MSDLPDGSVEDEFIARLTAHDDALQARRPTNLAEDTATLTPALRFKLEQHADWCEFVRAAWTLLRDGPEPDAAPTLSDSDTPKRFGRFEIRRELGRGAYGVVFLAFDPRLRRQVALKLPRPEVMVTAEMRARFEREARAAAVLDHPNLVPVFDAGEEGSISFIASAYCPGVTLSEWLKARAEPVPPRLAARIAATIAGAIGHAHARGVLHRDLKPGNVMLEPLPDGGPHSAGCDGMNFIPKVADFGLARMNTVGTEATAATQSGEILGTPSYMSPEQADGRTGAIGPATDVYGLGGILYALLTGRPPFQSHSPLDTMLLLRTQEPIAPSRLRPRLPRDLETVCLKCLDKRPQKRYASALVLEDDLERYLAGKPVVARRVGSAARLALWCRRQPALASTIAVAVLAIAAVASLGFWRVVRERDRFRTERDRAEATLVRALTGEARGLIQTRETSWRFTALEKLRQATQLAGPAQDRTEQRELAIESFGADVPCFRLEKTWTGHTGAVLGTAFSPDGQSVASGSRDGTIRVWSIGEDTPRLVLKGSEKDVTGVAFHPGGAWLAASTADGSVRVWKIGGGALAGPPLFAVKDQEPIHSVLFSPDGAWLAAGGDKGFLRMLPFDAAAADPVARAAEKGRTLTGHAGRVSDLAFSFSGKHFASASADTQVRLWDVATGGLLRRVALTGTFTPRGLAFCPEPGDEFAASIVFGTTEIYGIRWTDLRRHNVLGHAALAPEPITKLRIDTKSRVFTALADGSVRLWVRSILGLGTGYTSLAIASGEFGAALALDLSPDEEHIAVGYRDGRVRVWQLAEPAERAVLAERSHSIAFVGDSRRLVSSTTMTDFSNGMRAASRMRVEATVRAIEVIDNGAGLAFSRQDGVIRIWDNAARREAAHMQHGDWVHALALCPDGKLLASGSRDGTVKIWDWKQRTAVRTLAPELGEVNSVAWSPDGKELLLGGERGAAIWDLASGASSPRRLFESGPSPVAVAWGKNCLALSAEDGAIAVLDPRSGRRRQLLRGHSAHVMALSFLPDGRRLASVAGDGTLRVWDVESGKDSVILTLEGLGCFYVTIDPKGRYAITDCAKGTAVCDLRSGTIVAVVPHGTRAGRFSPDGSSFLVAHMWAGWVNRYSVAAFDQARSTSAASGGSGSRAEPLRPSSFEEIVPGSNEGMYWGIAASPNGRWIAACGNSGSIFLTDAQTITRPRVLSGHGGQAWSAASSADSKLLATGSENNRGSEIKLWDADSGRELHHLEALDGLVSGLAFVPGRNWLASCSFDGKVRLWDYEQSAPLGLVHAFGVAVRDVAVRGDGKWLAAACQDGSVALWEVNRLGKLPAAPHRSLSGHNAPVYAVTFHPDGRWLASGSERGTIILWDGSTFERIVRLRSGTGQIRCLRFSADGGLLAATAYGLPTIVWDLAQLRRSLGEMGLDW
jgi:WD40 repeat protein